MTNDGHIIIIHAEGVFCDQISAEAANSFRFGAPWAKSRHRLGIMDMLPWAIECFTGRTFLHLLQSACL